MVVTRRSLVFAGATALGGMALSGRAWPDAPAAVRAVLVQASGVTSRVTVALDRRATPRTFFLAEPVRFVIDIPAGRLAVPGGEAEGGGVVRR